MCRKREIGWAGSRMEGSDDRAVNQTEEEEGSIHKCLGVGALRLEQR